MLYRTELVLDSLTRDARAKKKNEFPPATNFLQTLIFPRPPPREIEKGCKKKSLPSLFHSFFSHDEHITLTRIVRFSRAVDFACCIREENSEDSKETKEEQGRQPTDKKEIP